MRLCREWNENGATSHEFLRKIDFVENGTTFHEFLRKKKDILAKRVQPLMSFQGKKKGLYGKWWNLLWAFDERTKFSYKIDCNLRLQSYSISFY